jgi:hypothetical protein
VVKVKVLISFNIGGNELAGVIAAIASPNPIEH